MIKFIDTIIDGVLPKALLFIVLTLPTPLRFFTGSTVVEGSEVRYEVLV